MDLLYTHERKSLCACISSVLVKINGRVTTRTAPVSNVRERNNKYFFVHKGINLIARYGPRPCKLLA